MGGSRKKSAAKRKSATKPPKYVIPPASPVATRSVASRKAVKSAESAVPGATPPTLLVVVPAAASDLAPSSTPSDLVAMEKRFDDRMAKMETSMRSSLTQIAASSRPRHHSLNGGESVQTTPPSSEPAPVSVSTRAASRSPSTSSSSSDSEDEWESSRSSDSSRSRSPSVRRHRHRSRRHHHKRSRSRSTPKHSKYSSAHYLRAKEKLNNYERLVVVNIRMALALMKRKKDIRGLLRHMLLIGEKAASDMFMDDALLNYDESVKDKAKDMGMKAYRRVDPAAIVEHLSYENTKNAANAKRGGGRKGFVSKTQGQGPGHCLKYNYDPRGCTRKECHYRHVCSACGSASHVNGDCPKRSSQK